MRFAWIQPKASVGLYWMKAGEIIGRPPVGRFPESSSGSR
jgi:hypothetical protein